MKIRKATVADAPAVVSCVIDSFKAYMLLIGRTPGPILEDYYVAIEEHYVFVAEEGGVICGVLLLKDTPEAEYTLLDVLATLPDWQGRGIGRALTAYGEDFIRGLGKKECRLYTHVKYERTASIYHSIGYETYARVQEYGFDRYYMKKAL